MKNARRDADPLLDIQGPAIVGPLHTLDRPATDKDMKPITGTAAWRKLTPLQAAFAKDQLAGGSERYTAADRYGAGQDYTAIFDAAQPGGRDSTQALNAISGGSRGSDSAARSKASSSLACIHSHMGHRDRQIIMLVCGEGYAPNEAIIRVLGRDYIKAVSARFREALDSLADAMEASRQKPVSKAVLGSNVPSREAWNVAT